MTHCAPRFRRHSRGARKCNAGAQAGLCTELSITPTSSPSRERAGAYERPKRPSEGRSGRSPDRPVQNSAFLQVRRHPPDFVGILEGRANATPEHKQVSARSWALRSAGLPHVVVG